MKRFWLILCSLLAFTPTFGQLAHHDWRIGVSGGFSTYYGDLSPYPVEELGDFGRLFKLFQYNEHYTERLSWQLSLEKRWTPTTGIMLHYGQHQFSMSDRYILPDGSLKTDAPNFDRALNFQTDLRDIGISLVLKTDNGRFLSKNAFFAPYISLGAGYLWFDVHGDLLDDEGNPYDNSSSSTLHNRRYETALPPLRTENEEGYSRHSWYGQFGLGFRLKISHRLELFVQSDFRHAFTDYLDDVSGQYRESYDSPFQEYAAHPGTNEINPDSPWRGNPNSQNDWYIYHGAGLKFSFGATHSDFSAPKVSSRYNYTPSQVVSVPDTSKQDSTAINEKTEGITHNYYTYLHWDNSGKLEELEFQFSNLQLEVEILEQQRLLDSISSKIDSSRFAIREYDLSIQKIKEDTLLSMEEKNNSIDQLQDLRSQRQLQMDSLQQRSEAIQSKIKSIREQKRAIVPVKEKGRIDSLAFIRELGQVPLRIQDALQRNDEATTAPSSSRLIAGESLSDTLEQAQALHTDHIRSQYMEWMRTLQKENQANQARTDSLLRVISQGSPGTPIQETREAPSSTSPVIIQEQEDRQPILIYERNRRTEKAPSQQPTSQVTPEPETTPSPINQQNGLVDGSTSATDLSTIAFTLGMQRLGLDLSTMDPSSISTPTEPVFEGDTSLVTPSSPTPVADTVYLEKSGKVKLIASKEDIFFESNQAQLSEVEMEKLKPLAEYILTHPDHTLHLTGYADNTGSLAYNLRLIDKRIEQVRQILLEELKVPAEQISVAMGGQIRRGPQSSSEEKDRRVEVKIIQTNHPTTP